MPIVVAHGEGRAEFENSLAARKALDDHKVALRYLDHYGEATEEYPLNPNGSVLGITGLTSDDGRFTIMMPHPERVFRSVQNSWHPDEWGCYVLPSCRPILLKYPTVHQDRSKNILF